MLTLSAMPALQATQDAGEAAQVRAGVGLLGEAPAAKGGHQLHCSRSAGGHCSQHTHTCSPACLPARPVELLHHCHGCPQVGKDHVLQDEDIVQLVSACINCK